MNKYALPDWIPEYLEDKSWTIQDYYYNKKWVIGVCGCCNGEGVIIRNKVYEVD